MFDFDALTLGEIAKVEGLAKQSIAQIASAETPKGDALAALVMVVKRRSGFPDFTFNQALALTLDEATEVLGWNDEEPDAESDEGKDERSSESATSRKRRSSSTSE